MLFRSGNSTYFGIDAKEELPVIVDRIRNVHVKDCTVKDYSVPLGRGDTDFATVFRHLATGGYSGALVLQAARQADEIAAARQYFSFTHDLVTRFWPSDDTDLRRAG